MSLASTFEEKTKIIADILSKMSKDECRIMLRMIIKEDMKLFFDTIFDERKFLEEETGIDDAYLIEQTGAPNTSEKVWINGEEVSKEIIREYTGLEINLAGKISKEAENTYYFDKKRSEKLGNDKYDGFLGYVSDKDVNKNDISDEKSDQVNGGENDTKK